MIGKTILHYKILEKLGEGGMGVVYKAEDIKLKREVAIKFLPRQIAASDDKHERFKIEAQAAAALNHPNIATIHAIEEVDGEMFIVMEFIDGKELRKTVETSGPDVSTLPIEKIITLATQIAEGLKAAHAKGITHRDIKSSNIMVTESGQAKIMDFGLAKIAGGMQLTKEHSTLGTAAYMSPEQARGEPVDHRTDIWSLGVVLYEMISGRLPFLAEYEQAVFYSILNETPEPIIPLGAGRTGVTMELERIINKALAKEPILRYQNVENMLVDLRALQIHAKSSALSKPSLKTQSAARQPLWRYRGVAAFVILLVAATLFFWPKKQPKQAFTSIAVLPFTDMSPQKDQEYFCDGMTEEILTKLSKLRELKVIARTSVMRYKDTDKSIKEIGTELRVATILEGSIRKEGDNIRVTAQLVKVEDESHLWAENYKKKLASVFDLQDEVSQAIAQALQVTLTPAKISTLASTPPKNTQAYEYYLKAGHQLSKFVFSNRQSDWQNAFSLYHQAIELDSTYALAYLGLAQAYHVQWLFGGFRDQQAVALKAKNAALALQFDPNSADAHAMMGNAYLSRGEFEKAYQSLKTALKLNSNLVEPNDTAANFLLNLGLIHQSAKYYARVIEIDPFYLHVYGLRASCLMSLGKLQEARAQLKKGMEFEEFIGNYSVGAELAILTKKYNEAESLIVKVEKFSPNMTARVKAMLLAAKGEKNKALALSQEPEIYALLGMKEKAIQSLKNQANPQTSLYLYLIHYPIFANFCDDQHFIEIVESEKKKYEENLQKYGDLGVE